MTLNAEALCLRCEILGLIGWNTTCVDVDGHAFFESFDVMDEGRVSCGGGAHDLASPSLPMS